MNKPLIDKFFDRVTSNEFGVPIEFRHNVPKKDVQTFILSPEVALSAEMLVRSKSFKMPSLAWRVPSRFRLLLSRRKPPRLFLDRQEPRVVLSSFA